MHCHSRLLTKLGVILNCLLCFKIMLDKWLDWYCYQSVMLSFNVVSNARPGHLYTTKIDASSILRKTVNMFNKMFKVFQAFKKRIKPSREQSRQGKKSGQNRMWALWAEVSGGHSTDRSHRPTTPDQTNSAEETNSDKKNQCWYNIGKCLTCLGGGCQHLTWIFIYSCLYSASRDVKTTKEPFLGWFCVVFGEENYNNLQNKFSLNVT